MALTAKQIADLNNAMEANRRAGVGNLLSQVDGQAIVRGTYTCVTADDTAVLKDLVTGLTAIAGWQIDIYRSNIKNGADVVVTATGGTLRVADGSTYKLTNGDKIYWLVW